jgi:lactoylglutathione lyase
MNFLKVTGIDHIKMEVKDLEAAVDFYSKLFGFKILEGSVRDFCIIGNDQVKLCLNQGNSNFCHFGFHIENYQDIKEICAESNVNASYVSSWKFSESTYIEDADNNEIELSKVWGGGLVE